MSKPDYDYIIAGGGLSGLSLAHRLIQSELSAKKILLVDQTLEPENDKIWSFWHKGSPPFQDLIYKSWKQIKVGFGDQIILQPLESYTYHSIKSSVFEKVVLNQLQNHASVDLLEDTIVSLEGDESHATLKTNTNSFTAHYIFQSCLTPSEIEQDSPCYPLIQHFLGWEVETADNVFDSSTVTLMNFDPIFSGGIAFIYILPQSPQKAMIEYTIFSDQLKQKPFYEEKLAIYLHNKYNLRPLDYKITRTEYGEIPMQDHRYVPRYAPRVINMGTVGGLTKPSTGYTFSRIQRHVEDIIHQLIANGKPALPHRSPFRYRAYDLWLLQIIYDHPETALQIFEQLFSNNSMDEIFRFLSEDNSLLQDLKTMSKVAYPPFFSAMWKTKKRLFEL